MFQCDRNQKKGATQHASRHNVNKPVQNLKKKHQKLYLFKRTDQYSGQEISLKMLESVLGRLCQRIVCRIDRLNFICNCRKLSSCERDAVINPPLVISFTAWRLCCWNHFLDQAWFWFPSGLGSPSEPSEAYQLPSLILCVYSATKRTSSSRQISETHVKPFLVKVTLKFSFKAQ